MQRHRTNRSGVAQYFPSETSRSPRQITTSDLTIPKEQSVVLDRFVAVRSNSCWHLKIVPVREAENMNSKEGKGMQQGLTTRVDADQPIEAKGSFANSTVAKIPSSEGDTVIQKSPDQPGKEAHTKEVKNKKDAAAESEVTVPLDVPAASQDVPAASLSERAARIAFSPTQPGAVAVAGPDGEADSVGELTTNESAVSQVVGDSNPEHDLITAFRVEEQDDPTIYEAEAISEEEKLRKRRQRTQRVLIIAGAIVIIAGAVIAAVVVVSTNKRKGGSTQFVKVTNAPSFSPTNNPTLWPTLSPTSPITWESLGQDLLGKAAGERFGSFADISGNGNVLAVVTNTTIQVYKMNRATDTWQEHGGDSLQNETGSVVSLSENGGILAVGKLAVSNGTLPGKVRIFQLRESDSHWIQRGSDINGLASDDRFGSSVSLSDDGFILAICASDYLSIYAYNSLTDSWGQLGQNITAVPSVYPLGSSISLSGDGQVVTVGENGQNRVRVYEFNALTDKWIQLGSDVVGEAYFYFGTSVSLSSNGRILASGDPVQTPGSQGASAAAYAAVYEYIEATKNWMLRGEAIETEEGTDGIGTICVSSDGNIVAIGTPFNDGAGFSAGSVRIHQYDAELGSWMIIGPDIDGVTAFDEAGAVIALSGNGDVLVVSTGNNDANGEDSGLVRVFQVAGGRFTPAPSVSWAPTGSPSMAPTFLSSYINLDSGCGGFKSINDEGGNATLINFDNACPGICEPCTSAVTIELPFTFLWFGDTPITSVAIDFGGQINIDNSLDVMNGVAEAIEAGGPYNRPRIAVLKTDGIVYPSGINGVLTLDTGTSFIISWENAAVLHPSGFLSIAYYQAELFPNGDIAIRWEGEVYTDIVIGVEDNTRSPPEAFQGCGPFEVRQQ